VKVRGFQVVDPAYQSSAARSWYGVICADGETESKIDEKIEMLIEAGCKSVEENGDDDQQCTFVKKVEGDATFWLYTK